jgi:hypothetical protein
VAGACDARIIDDYRESAIIIQGTVNAAGGPAIVGAVLEFTADTPRYLFGDTTTSDLAGSFSARLTSFGVGTFTASVRLQARRTAMEPVVLDTMLVGLSVVEARGAATPDTIRLALELSDLQNHP